MIAKRWIATISVVVVGCLAPADVQAQRELHWEALDVEARLDAQGTLHVVETQRMVFTGEWNGGERQFDIRPRQGLVFSSIERQEADGTLRPLAMDSSLDDVDEYAQTDDTTWRWRSRMTGDPPFANTRITYVLRYELSRVLLGDGTSYRLNHDFAFPEREGVIERVTVRLTLDPVWTAASGLQDVYRGGPLEPGKSFTLTIPLQYAGASAPLFDDTRRPREVVLAVSALIAVTALAIAAFFIREQRRGRFAPLKVNEVSEEWLRTNLLAHPAEVVGAAWDEDIGSSEVVALIARLVAEGKLESTVTGSTMRLRLLTDRDAFRDHEAALVGGLFFDANQRETSTDAVKRHYRKTGFNPATLIKKGLSDAVSKVLPEDGQARVRRWITLGLFIVAVAAMATELITNFVDLMPVVMIVMASVAAGLLQIPGVMFRQRMKWNRAHAVACLLPAIGVLLGMVWLLWWIVGTGRLQPSPAMLVEVVALTLWMINASVNGLKSRQNAAAIAFRKRLTTAREFFKAQLAKPDPLLRDEWYPWILAFGLGRDADRWADHFGTSGERARSPSSSGRVLSTSSSSSSSSSDGWTGAAGGRSGGGGGGAAWTAAAASMAAGVSPPSSSGSGGGSSSSSSSSSGSSGGGGGGGW
jgi:hypothetical protein